MSEWTSNIKASASELPVPRDSQLEIANKEINRLFSLFYSITNPPANSTQMSSALKIATNAIEEFTQRGMHADYHFMEPAWEYLAKLGARVSKHVQSEPKYRQDGCLMVETFPGLERLHREWEVQERNLQAILTRIDIQVARMQDPTMTRDAAKVLIGLKPRLFLDTTYS
jgi:hypothetical protein